MPDISTILRQATPREGRVPVCLAGDLAGELEQVQAEMALIGDGWQPSSMGDVHPATVLARQADDIRARMRAASTDFHFKALGHTAFSNLLAEHPADSDTSGVPYNPATFLPTLLAACCTDPVMTVDEALQLLGLLNDGQAQELFNAALRVNEEPSPLPF